jgi:peroxiredoxin
MSRRRVAAVTALIVVPVVVLAIVLVSIVDGGSPNDKPAQTTQPATRPAVPDQRSSPPSASRPGKSGGAKPPATPLPVLDAGSPPKQLSDKLRPASSDGTIDLAELRGAPIVLNIWSADCTPCRGEARVLQSEWERLGPRGVLFLGLNVLDTPASARQFRSDYDVTYPSLEEKRADTARKLGARGVPETFFISKGGKIVSHVIGGVSLGQIEIGVKAAQTGRAMPTDQGGGQIPLR